ncbi:MAG TPA: TIGR04086 family membrane protein [Acetivibrio sp.]|uniref:TIGR04086 family membrane protein n=1 Tax=Acetivibrio sp. TaxID=1872092 RepID=UPI002CF7F89C|nr:TIGR04086 family membrane protein [Acetivibrio sp.]HOM03017.1 TIGR04086 family membrane protein [Acetivibrio sp.]
MINKTGQAAKNILSGHTNVITIIKGILISYLFTLPMFAIFAYFLRFTDFPLKYMSTAVIITTLLSIVIAGWISAKNVKSKGWLNGAIVGFIYMLILYLISSIVYRDFAVNSYVLILLAIGVLSGSIGGILGINLKR